MAKKGFAFDLEDEVYGYGMLNVHKNCLIDLPETSGEKLRTDIQITEDAEENILKKIADHYDLDDVSHLKVVEVRLSNSLDEKAVEELP
ncbi:hypothetical protein [Natrinema sp. H-ect4]|uniref:hypothetical protein n=1 Tax=Natrinema sp. H-ect4 TaxID=3242699 RepID=UPI0035A817FA